MCIFMYVFSNVKWRGGLSPPLEWDFFGVLLSWYLLNLKLPTSLISTDLFSNTFNQGKRTETIPSLENHWRFCASTSCGSIDGDPWEYHDGEPSEPSDGTSYTFGTSTTSVNWNDASWKYPWRILDSFFFLGWGEKKNRVGGWVGVNWTGEKAKLCVYFFFKCISVGLNCFGVLDNGFSRIHFGPLRRTSIDWHLIWTDLHRTWIPFFFRHGFSIYFVDYIIDMFSNYVNLHAQTWYFWSLHADQVDPFFQAFRRDISSVRFGVLICAAQRRERSLIAGPSRKPNGWVVSE